MNKLIIIVLVAFIAMNDAELNDEYTKEEMNAFDFPDWLKWDESFNPTNVRFPDGTIKVKLDDCKLTDNKQKSVSFEFGLYKRKENVWKRCGTQYGEAALEEVATSFELNELMDEIGDEFIVLCDITEHGIPSPVSTMPMVYSKHGEEDDSSPSLPHTPVGPNDPMNPVPPPKGPIIPVPTPNEPPIDADSGKKHLRPKDVDVTSGANVMSVSMLIIVILFVLIVCL